MGNPRFRKGCQTELATPLLPNEGEFLPTEVLVHLPGAPMGNGHYCRDDLSWLV